ncbi:hematopoietic death receptor, partial [Aplochiton taeniatus]
VRAGSRNRAQREVSCRENLEYLHENICCRNCPAGQYVKLSCNSAGQRGTCETCDLDTYTEHENGLKQCLKCTKCHSDQEIVRRCTITQDTVCQCKSGQFCLPDQACEVCKTCSKCKDNEVKVGNCTSTSNTQCTRGLSTSNTISGTPSPGTTEMINHLPACAAVYDGEESSADRQADPTNPSVEERQNSENREIIASQLYPLLESFPRVRVSASEDEDNGLGDSLPNTNSSSQSSLSAQPLATVPTAPPHPSTVFTGRPHHRGDDQLPKLLPLNGEDSFRKCFELFEEMDVDYHKRFFRHIGLPDNVIKSRDHLNPEDRIHELLNVWLEKVGKEADIAKQMYREAPYASTCSSTTDSLFLNQINTEECGLCSFL